MTMTEYVLNTLYHNHWSFSAKIFKIFLMKTFPLHCKELKWGDRFLLQCTGRLAKYKISARSTFLQGLLVLNILCMTDQQIYISTFPKYSAIVFTTIFLWFQQIRRDSINHDHTTVEASKAENRHLNRYRDVYPYDHSRVVIYDCDETDYINASLVQVRLIRDFLNMDRKVQAKFSNFFLWNNSPKMQKRYLYLCSIVSYIRIFSSISSFLWPGQAFELYYSHCSKKTEIRPR